MKNLLKISMRYILIFSVAIIMLGGQFAEAFVAGRLMLQAARKSSVIRKTGGRAFASKAMMKSSKNWFKRQALAGQIPKEILKKLNGKKYKNFDSFRKAFWKEISKHKHLVKKFKAFNSQNGNLLKKGLAPLSPKGQHVGKLKKFALHHKKRIADGGSVYDLSNLLITSPLYHKSIHNGK